MSDQLDRIERKLDSVLSQFGAVIINDNINADLYDKYGVSFETSKYGGVKLRAVEELYQRWIKKGGQHKQVAETMNHWFCFLRPDKALSEDVFNQISSNQQKAWIQQWLGADAPVISEYHIIKGKYKHVKTGQYVFKRPVNYFHDDYKNWKRVQFDSDGVIDGHDTATFGDYSSPDYSWFYEDFVKRIPEAVQRVMNGKIANLNDPTRREHPIR